MTEPKNADHDHLSVTVVTVPRASYGARDARTADLAYATDRYDEHFLRCAALVLTEALSESVLREFAIRLPVPYLADCCVLHLITTAPGGMPPIVVECAHLDPDQEPRVWALWQQAMATTPLAVPPLTQVLRAHEASPPPARLQVDLARMTPDTIDSPAAELLIRCNLAMAVHVPLLAGTRTYGVLTFASLTPGRYGPRQVALAIAYASWVAGALDRAQSRPPTAESVYESVPVGDAARA